MLTLHAVVIHLAGQLLPFRCVLSIQTEPLRVTPLLPIAQKLYLHPSGRQLVKNSSV